MVDILPDAVRQPVDLARNLPQNGLHGNECEAAGHLRSFLCKRIKLLLEQSDFVSVLTHKNLLLEFCKLGVLLITEQ